MFGLIFSLKLFEHLNINYSDNQSTDDGSDALVTTKRLNGSTKNIGYC